MNGYDHGSGLHVEVRRTKPVSPSKLSTFLHCPLRYIFETERPRLGAIPSGAMALKGTAVHQVIQFFSGGPLPSVREIRDAFVHAVAVESARPDGNALIHHVVEGGGASALFEQAQMVAAIQFIRKVLLKYKNDVTSRYPAHRVADLKVLEQKQAPFGMERKLSSTCLDMEGRVDLLYRDRTGTIHVTDFKTGKVLDAESGPQSGYLMQLAAYGVLTQETFGPEEIVLELIGPTSEWTGPLDSKLECSVRTLISTIQTRLPKDEAIETTTIAAPGAHCHNCAYRPSCPIYISLLDSGEHNGGVISPFDFSATIAEATQHGEMITLRAYTNRHTAISLSGVPSFIYQGLTAGASIRAFSLGAFDVLLRAAFPANFYMYRTDSTKASAFASMIVLKNLP